MKTCHRLIGLSIVFCFLVGCQKPATSVIKVDSEDDRMNVAMEKGNRTFSYFVDQWKSLAHDGCSIKVGMPTSKGGLEYIWFHPVAIDGEEITGTCDNDPEDIAGLRFGDTRKFKKAEVVDWMIMVGDTCHGGYTIKALGEITGNSLPGMKFHDPAPDK